MFQRWTRCNRVLVLIRPECYTWPNIAISPHVFSTSCNFRQVSAKKRTTSHTQTHLCDDCRQFVPRTNPHMLRETSKCSSCEAVLDGSGAAASWDAPHRRLFLNLLVIGSRDWCVSALWVTNGASSPPPRSWLEYNLHFSHLTRNEIFFSSPSCLWASW